MLRWRTLAVTVAGLVMAAPEHPRASGFRTVASRGRPASAAICSNASWSKLGPKVFFCQNGSCAGGPAFSGTHWLLFGGGFVDTDPPGEGFVALSMAEQQVSIPAAPAVLGFMLNNQGGADVSQFAGPGRHNLRFEYTCGSTCARVSVDDISLDAADVPAAPPSPVLPVMCGTKLRPSWAPISARR